MVAALDEDPAEDHIRDSGNSRAIIRTMRGEGGGTNRTNRAGLVMSVVRGRPELTGRLPKWRF
jgi:hypothetical protein